MKERVEQFCRWAAIRRSLFSKGQPLPADFWFAVKRFKRARVGRGLAAESAFMGLADFCVTRGIEIWPYPQPVFERPEHWTMGTERSIPARVMAFDDCSANDRYYMLAARYDARKGEPAVSQKRRMALAMVDLGLPQVVRFASWTRRRMRGIRSRLSLGRIERRLERLLSMERMKTSDTAIAFDHVEKHFRIFCLAAPPRQRGAASDREDLSHAAAGSARRQFSSFLKGRRLQSWGRTA